ncbi:MAG: DUF1304 domain-containing protein [Xanthomonadales bacterium]|nr:DUF1304 domain-containing protein [Xanthomonadales bacterium]
MLLVAQIFAGLVLLIHVYIVLLETVLFRTRGAKVFRMDAQKVELVAPLMVNQGCYNGFLVAAIAFGFLWPEPAIARALMMFGLACVAVAGLVGGATVMRKIFFIQTVPATIALAAYALA